MAKYEHVEDEKVRGTFIKELSDEEIAEKRKETEDMRKKGLVVTIGDNEFTLEGFTTVIDKMTKDEILHYKIKINPNGKKEDNFILYHLTPHPDSLKMLNTLKLFAEMHGLNVVNIVEYCRHIVKLYEDIQQGKVNYPVLKGGACSSECSERVN